MASTSHKAPQEDLLMEKPQLTSLVTLSMLNSPFLLITIFFLKKLILFSLLSFTPHFVSTITLTNVYPFVAGEILGFLEFIPPHANTSGSDILKGVNYASGGAGIRPDSGMIGGDNIDLEKQVRNHKAIFSKIADKVGGPEKAKQYLKKCLYYVNIGNNDYIYNYFFFPIYLTKLFYTPQQFANNLLLRLFKYIQELHVEFGARKFVVVGVVDIGCTPDAMSMHGTNGSCVEEMSDAAFIFNDKLKSQVDQFNNHSSTDSKSIFVPSLDRSIFPGFHVANASCCPTPCLPNKTPCQNRSEYVFWDGLHPTEAANRITAQRSYNDIMRLVQSSIQTTTSS